MLPSAEANATCAWPRGGAKCCGTLTTPGASHGWRKDETDHCFPASASDHMVCCVDIKNMDNEVNTHDPNVAHNNPLSGPISRNSHKSSYSWCVDGPWLRACPLNIRPCAWHCSVARVCGHVHMHEFKSCGRTRQQRVSIHQLVSNHPHVTWHHPRVTWHACRATSLLLQSQALCASPCPNMQVYMLDDHL